MEVIIQPHKDAAASLVARIVACCDAYDAMTSDRPYRKALPREAAIIELKAHAGSQFDPDVVVALVEVVGDVVAAPALAPSLPEGALALTADGEFTAGLLAPSADRPELEGILERAGSVAVSEESAEILRVEAGRPRFGSDARAPS